MQATPLNNTRNKQTPSCPFPHEIQECKDLRDIFESDSKVCMQYNGFFDIVSCFPCILSRQLWNYVTKKQDARENFNAVFEPSANVLRFLFWISFRKFLFYFSPELPRLIWWGIPTRLATPTWRCLRCGSHNRSMFCFGFLKSPRHFIYMIAMKWYNALTVYYKMYPFSFRNVQFFLKCARHSHKCPFYLHFRFQTY